MKNYKNIFVFGICCFIFSGILPNAISAGSLDFTTKGVFGEKEALWDFQHYGFEPLFWNNTEVSIEKRIAVLNYVIGRLEFIKHTCPELEKKISIRGNEKNVKEIVKMINEQIGVELPVVYNCNYEIKHTFTIKEIPAYEIIEVVCLGAGYDPIYNRNKIEIRDRK